MMTSKKRIVLFPFMAQGHLIPFISLAKKPSERHPCYNITLINTPLNIKNLRPSIPPNSTSIQLAELPFSSSDHGLPQDTETTESLPLHHFINFFRATETLKPSFEAHILELIQAHGRSNLCIIADMFLGWTSESAAKLGVFHSVFVTSGAYSSAMFFSLWLNPPKVGTDGVDDEEEFALLDFPEIRLHRSFIANTIITSDGTDPITAFMRRQLSLSFDKSSGLLLNTSEEFEQEGLRLLRRSPGLPVWSIGPLISHVRSSSSSSSYSTVVCDCSIDSYCMEWLDTKAPASVLYVSFGSQNSIPASQMKELAKGLEASGRHFIWVIRPPPPPPPPPQAALESNNATTGESEWLPECFEERMREKDQGKILVGKWAPQLKILSHESTAAFLSHCGWNSVMESLSQGVPIIGWPLIGDQLFNSKMLEEEMQVGVEIARGMQATDAGLRDGWRGVAEAVELVMGGTSKGKEMRRKASSIKEMMRRAMAESDGTSDAGSSVRSMDDFLRTAFD